MEREKNGYLALVSPAAIPRDRLPLPPGGLRRLQSLVAEVTGEDRAEFELEPRASATAGKLTVTAMRPDGTILGRIKISQTPDDVERIDREAAVLARFRDVPQLRGDVPELLFAGKRDACHLLFHSHAEGAPGPARFSRLHTHFLENLRHAAPVRRSGDGLVEEIGTLWDWAAARLDLSCYKLGRDALRLAGRELHEVEIACGVWHGDFAPRNMRLRDGRLFVFNWESAEWDMPVWWDMFHFDLDVASQPGQESGIDLKRLDAPAWNGIYLLYLLRAVARSVEDHSPADVMAFRKQRLMEQVAQRHCPVRMSLTSRTHEYHENQSRRLDQSQQLT